MDGMAGNRRPGPYAPDNRSDAIRRRTEPSTPAQTADGWASRLKERPHALVAWLGAVSAGNASCIEPAQGFINELIRHEEYGVFVEVFAAYGAILQSEATREGRGYVQPGLVLELPADWSPAAPVAMADAFCQIHAQRVEVRSGGRPVPEAVTHALVSLLQAGTTELATDGLLTSPELLCKAFAASQLRSVELTPMPPKSPTASNDQESGFVRFMKAVAQCPSLSEVKTSKSFHLVSSLEKVFFEPLTGHPSLRKLDILRSFERDTTAQSLLMMPKLVAFSVTCPNLTDFGWKHPGNCSQFRSSDHAAKIMRQFKADDCDLDMTAIAAAMVKAMATPGFRLQFLALHDVPLPPGVLKAFFRALATNTSLLSLDLHDCCIDLEATVDLLLALEQNATLESTGLPRESACYYLRSVDPRRSIYGFEFDTLRSYQNAYLSLFISNLASDETRGWMGKTFGPLREHVQNLCRAIRAAPMRANLANESRMLLDKNYPQLEANVRAVMAAGLSSAARGAVTAYPGGFADAAKLVTQMMVKDLYVSDAVRLTEVSKAVAQYREETSVKPEEAVNLRRLNRKEAREVRETRSDRPRPMVSDEVNRKDARGANLQLLKAAVAVDVALVYTLMARGAIDFEDYAKEAATSIYVRAALLHRPGAEWKTTNINTSAVVTTTARSAAALDTVMEPTAATVPERSALAVQRVNSLTNPSISVMRLLADIAFDLETSIDDAQLGFNEMIRGEKYGMFLEVFEAYNRIARAAREKADGEPFKTSLKFRLPADWRPAAPMSLEDAFRKLKLDQVEVVPSAQPDPVTGLTVPEAVTQAVAVLMASGVTELVGVDPVRSAHLSNT